MPPRGLAGRLQTRGIRTPPKFTDGFFLEINNFSGLFCVRHSSPSQRFLQFCTAQGSTGMRYLRKCRCIFFYMNTQTFVEHEIEHTHTHTPITSVGMAVPTPRATAALLIVTHVSLSAPSITTPQTFLPLFLELPSQKPFTAFHLSAFSLCP